MFDPLPPCQIPLARIRLARPLFHLARQLGSGAPVRIVAIGSSSTAGEGGIPPYPVRLQAAMNVRYPERGIEVANSGKSGEQAARELARFDRDVIDLTPAMVIWQVGTNEAWKAYDLDDMAAAIDAGLKRLTALPMDVVLMDLQYTAAMLAPDEVAVATTRMVALIALAAENAGVNLFRRFDLMRSWHEIDGIPVEKLANVSDDTHLHQSEWATDGVAHALDAAIADAVTRADQAMVMEPGPRAGTPA